MRKKIEHSAKKRLKIPYRYRETFKKPKGFHLNVNDHVYSKLKSI